jgi:hypothetical protein
MGLQDSGKRGGIDLGATNTNPPSDPCSIRGSKFSKPESQDVSEGGRR